MKESATFDLSLPATDPGSAGGRHEAPGPDHFRSEKQTSKSFLKIICFRKKDLVSQLHDKMFVLNVYKKDLSVFIELVVQTSNQNGSCRYLNRVKIYVYTKAGRFRNQQLRHLL